MSSDQNPIHRKVIAPWYDSEVAGIIVMFLMVFVFLFGVSGFWVSRQAEEYHAYGWVAILLTILSGWVIVSIGYRLMKRNPKRNPDFY